MKRLLFSIWVVMLCSHLYAAEPDSILVRTDAYDKECVCKGIPLHGKVKIVSYNADLKVKIVDNFGDINVKVVERWPDDCGEWQFVEHWPDFTIQIVEYGEDLKVHFVNNWPGMR